jgi:hypothetical protein
MPGGRWLEGATGPADGLGGKWSSFPTPVIRLAGGDDPRGPVGGNLFPRRVWAEAREGGVKEGGAPVKKS